MNNVASKTMSEMYLSRLLVPEAWARGVRRMPLLKIEEGASGIYQRVVSFRTGFSIVEFSSERSSKNFIDAHTWLIRHHYVHSPIGGERDLYVWMGDLVPGYSFTVDKRL